MGLHPCPDIERVSCFMMIQERQGSQVFCQACLKRRLSLFWICPQFFLWAFSEVCEKAFKWVGTPFMPMPLRGSKLSQLSTISHYRKNWAAFFKQNSTFWNAPQNPTTAPDSKSSCPVLLNSTCLCFDLGPLLSLWPPLSNEFKKSCDFIDYPVCVVKSEAMLLLAFYIVRARGETFP